MNILDIDKNFQLPEMDVTDIEWFDCTDTPFSLHGIFYDDKIGGFLRLPKDIADATSQGVSYLSLYTAGGRVRFNTNSPYIAIKYVTTATDVVYHMPYSASHGFSLYVNNKFRSVFPNDVKNVYDNYHKLFALQFVKDLGNSADKELKLYFPLYNCVDKLYIGVKKGSKILPPKDYTYKNPVVFYGSSITQGGCASRAGADYVSKLERALDTDIINLGFSGSGRGEEIIANYIASIKNVGAFVMDYDYNAPTLEHLVNTHYRFYEILRSKNPSTPIIMISSPNKEYKDNGQERCETIKNTYLKAKELGDNNVYFIDGGDLYGDADRDECTVDLIHPNDLGFYRMAKVIEPVLRKALEK